jgi:hypothetical protein
MRGIEGRPSMRKKSFDDFGENEAVAPESD